MTNVMVSLLARISLLESLSVSMHGSWYLEGSEIQYPSRMFLRFSGNPNMILFQIGLSDASSHINITNTRIPNMWLLSLEDVTSSSFDSFRMISLCLSSF